MIHDGLASFRSFPREGKSAVIWGGAFELLCYSVLQQQLRPIVLVFQVVVLQMYLYYGFYLVVCTLFCFYVFPACLERFEIYEHVACLLASPLIHK